MQIALPHNIFTTVMYEALPDSIKPSVLYKPAAALSQLLHHNKVDIALLPVMDLLTHRDLFVSSKRGISFESELSNSYIYFKPGQVELNHLALGGDISSTEVILSKILIKELYGAEVDLRVLPDYKQGGYDNLLLVGDDNYQSELYSQAVNFSEEVVELLNLPFVNFVFCANDADLLRQFEEQTSTIEANTYAEVEAEEWEFRLNTEVRDYFQQNISHVIYNFEEQDKEGIVQLLRLPYFHGIAKDLIDVRFT